MKKSKFGAHRAFGRAAVAPMKKVVIFILAVVVMATLTLIVLVSPQSRVSSSESPVPSSRDHHSHVLPRPTPNENSTAATTATPIDLPAERPTTPTTSETTKVTAPVVEKYDSVIPRVRRIVWKSKTLLPSAETIDNNWRANESSFSHVIHDDAECHTLAKRYAAERASNTPEVRFMPASQQRLLTLAYKYNFTEVYENYQLNVMRADVCRVLVIYYYGGFYMDLDVDFARPLKDWNQVRWEATDLLLGMEYGSPQRDITNFFFAATARHPCLRILLEHLHRHGQDPNPFMLRERNAIHKHTGPTVWLHAFKECRVPREYLHMKRTVYHEGGRTSSERIGYRFYEQSHVRQNNYHNVKDQIGWFEPLPQIDREDLHGILIAHKYGSNNWKDEMYGSWTAKERILKLKLKSGEPLEAMGARALAPKREYLARPVDPDEVHLSLIRKHRFVVWQNSTPMSGATLANYNNWQLSEPHFTHQIVSEAECLSLAWLMSGKKASVVSDTLCGLLAVHLTGGGFYMHHSVKRTKSFFDWPEVSFSVTDVLLLGDAPNTVHTELFGVSPQHPCSKHALDRLMYRSARIGVDITPAAFWEAWRECTINDAYLEELRLPYDRRFVLYGINNYAMGVRLEYLMSLGFPRSFAKTLNGEYLLRYQPKSSLPVHLE